MRRDSIMGPGSLLFHQCGSLLLIRRQLLHLISQHKLQNQLRPLIQYRALLHLGHLHLVLSRCSNRYATLTIISNHHQAKRQAKNKLRLRKSCSILTLIDLCRVSRGSSSGPVRHSRLTHPMSK